MGSQSSKPIKVATANYSGITNSPFEFYSENTKELDELNRIFKILFSQIPSIKLKNFDAEQILKQYTNYKDLEDKPGSIGKELTTSFDWKINNIQKSLQKGRFCPQYREDAGVENGAFLRMQDFFRKWEAEYNKNIKYVKVNEPNPKKDLPLDKQKDVCKVFDFLVFKTFVEYSYQQVYDKCKKEKWMEIYKDKMNITIEDRDNESSKETRTRRKNVVAYYESFMQRYHRKPYLRHELKFKFIKELIETHDIVFVQDSCDQMINEVKNEGEYTIIEQMEDRDCYIIIRSDFKRIGQMYDAVKYIKQQKDENSLFHMKKFNYSQNNDPGNNCYPAICLVDRFLLMSIHMSSRKQKKYQQIVKFMRHVLEIHEAYRGKLQIIIGGDFNSNIKAFTDQPEHQEFYEKSPEVRKQHESILFRFWQIFHSHPDNERSETITTRKMRTWLQSQAKKSQKNDELSRDFLISNYPLQKCKVITNGTGMNETLPTEKHPFDHFFISAQLSKLGERAQRFP